MRIATYNIWRGGSPRVHRVTAEGTGIMTATTLFTWGYYGWGNHTPQLVEAVEAAEASSHRCSWTFAFAARFEPRASKATHSRSCWAKTAIAG